MTMAPRRLLLLTLVGVACNSADGVKCGVGTRLEDGVCVRIIDDPSSHSALAPLPTRPVTTDAVASTEAGSMHPLDAASDAFATDASVPMDAPKRRAHRACIANNKPCLSERVTDSSDSLSCAHCCSGRYEYAAPGDLPQPKNLGESELDALCRCQTTGAGRGCHADAECCNGKCVPPSDNYATGGVGHCYGAFPGER